MATTVPEADMRALHEIGLRAWPAETTHHDGSWAIRLTPGSPTNRQNSANPLDRDDAADLDRRIDSVVTFYDAAERHPTFLISPLAPPRLDTLLVERGWTMHDESMVMTAAPTASDDTEPRAVAEDEWLTLQIAHASFVTGRRRSVAATLARLAEREGKVARLWAHEASSLLAVRIDEHLGLFNVATDPAHRRAGHGARLMASTLAAAAAEGASRVWLQVERANHAAVALYERFGFREAYGYHYRKAPE